MDARAIRMQSAAPGVAWFEVDTQASQQEKRAALAVRRRVRA